MKNKFLFILFIITFSVKIYSQDQLKTYTPPDDSTVKNNPSTIPKIGDCGQIYTNNIGHNDDFAVSVKKSTDYDWTPLFEYNTFVNSGRDLSSSTRSSFVTFDYSGTVNIQVVCKNFKTIDAQKVLIRPQSRNINWTVLGNVITITLVTPPVSSTNGKTFSDKLSIELNGDRYHNLHIFANNMQSYVEPTGSHVIVYNKINNGKIANIYDKSLDNEPKKIIIEEGAIVTIPYNLSIHNSCNIKLNENDEVYIKGGGILKGGIFAENTENIKVYGHGIIDLTDFPKQYGDNPNNYAYNQGITLRQVKNVLLDGLIINDSQQVSVYLQECGGSENQDGIENIKINNLKLFSRVLWGDGFHMRGSSNISINDCFARTSDDSMAIYPSKNDSINSQNRDALNIRATNTILYADNAHDIAIGWHGNQQNGNGNNIYNLSFDNIDILEQDQNWTDQDGFIHSEYDGAIGIKCSDENKCDNFIFSNIRIEDFTSGSILSVRVMPGGWGSAATNGKYVQNIKFHNLSYIGSGERKIVIQGIDCDRYVNGVHFENLRINNNLITKLSDYTLPLTQITSFPIAHPPLYDTNGFDINKFAYNITFEEGNNYSTSLADGDYTIQNMSDTNLFLQNSSNYITSNNGNNRVWHIEQIMSSGQPTGHYVIKPINDLAKALTGKIFDITQPDPYCNGRYIVNDQLNGNTNQQWKILGDNTNGYKIINAYLISYLTKSNNISNSNTVLLSKNDNNNFQKWKINTTSVKFPNSLESKYNINSRKKITISPNPTNDILNIANLEDNLNYKIEITDISGKLLIKTETKSGNFAISTKGLITGGYFIYIYLDNKAILKKKFLKI